MPRGGRSRGRSVSPIRRAPAPRTTAVAPQRQRAPAPVPQQPMAMGQPRQGPGLMGQMAATAGGVAIGSAVGHVVGSAISGGNSNQPDVTYQEPAPQGGQPQQQYQTPCQYQLEQFLQCTQNQSDIGLCQGFNDALKECKFSYGLQ